MKMYLKSFFIFTMAFLATQGIFAQDIRLSQEGGTSKDIMFVAPAEYDLLTNWLTVRDAQSISMQDYLMSHLERRQAEQLIIRYTNHAGESSMRSGCACVVVAPYTIIDNYPATEEVVAYNNGSGLNYESRRIAAARKDDLNLLTITNETGYSVYSGNNESSNSTAALRVTYICTNNTGNIDNSCGCEKTMNLKTNYESNLSATTSLAGNCSARYANAKMEDNVVLLAYNIDPANTTSANTQVLEAGKALVDRSQKVNTNPQFVTNMVNLTVSALTTAITGTFTATDLTNIGNGINAVINTPINIVSGNVSGDGVTSANLSVLYDNAITLKPNVPKVVMLISKGQAFAKGKRSCWGTYQARAQLSSGYSMVGVIAYDNTPASCCIEKSGVWNLQGYPAAPISVANFRNSIGAYLSAHGAWNNLSTVGGVNGNVAINQNTGFATSTPQCAGCQTPGSYFTLSGIACIGDVLSLNGTGSTNETDYRISIQSVNSSTNVPDGFLNWNTPWTNGTVGVINLSSMVALPSGHKYKITLEVMNACAVVSYYAYQYTPSVFCMESPSDNSHTTKGTSAKLGHGDTRNETALFNVFPNPTTTELNLNYTDMEDAEAQLNIFDITGKLVMQQKVQANNSNSIDVSNISTGVYVAQLLGANINKSIKFVKQ